MAWVYSYLREQERIQDEYDRMDRDAEEYKERKRKENERRIERDKYARLQTLLYARECGIITQDEYETYVKELDECHFS